MVAEDGLAFKDLPIIDQSLVDMLGSGSVDVLNGIKTALTTVKSSLSDMQAMEIDLNFELDKNIDLGLDGYSKDNLLESRDHGQAGVQRVHLWRGAVVGGHRAHLLRPGGVEHGEHVAVRGRRRVRREAVCFRSQN